MKKITLCAALALSAVFFADVNAQQVENEDGVTINVTSTGEPVTTNSQNRGALILDNGPHFNVPGNPNISLLENTTLGLGTLGLGVSGAFSIADDFTLASTYDISAIDLYAYQTGAPTAPASINAVFIQIWDGDPSVGGSNIIYGDLTTDLLDNIEWSNTYRESETTPGTGRAIFRVTANTTGLQLAAGTYWLNWSYAGDPSFSGPWQPPVVVLGSLPSGNGYQSNAGTYTPAADSGTGDIFDFPFQMYGTEVLGVNDNSLENQVSISPNPAVNNVTISNRSSSTLDRAEVYNIQGRLLQTVSLDATSTDIDISGYPTGIYMVQVFSEKGSFTKKIVKK